MRTYDRAWLRTDLVAALTVFAILVPSALAYGELAGLPAVTGLYTAVAAMVVYALFGTSRQLILGPEATTAILAAAAVGALAGGDAARYAALAAVLAILIGVTLFGAGLLKIGFIADFLSQPILAGYITGSALLVMESQLGKLFGISISSSGFFQGLWELLTNLGETHLLTLALGIVFILLLVLLRRFFPRLPASLIVVVVAIIASSVFHFAARGVAVVGAIPAGLPRLTIPQVGLADVWSLALPAISISLIIFADAVLTARVFAKKNGYEIDANQELIGVGLANAAAGLFQGFNSAASSSRTVVNDNSGGKSQVVGLISSALVLIFLLFFTSLLQNLPTVALAAIIIVAGFSLIEIKPLRDLFQVRSNEGYLALLTLFGVLTIGILQAILIAIGLSLILLIGRITRPHVAVLGVEQGVDGFHETEEADNTETLPGLIAYRFDAPLFFANAEFFHSQANAMIAAAQSPIKWFIIDAEALTDIDATALAALEAFHDELMGKGITLAFARVSDALMEMLRRGGLVDRVGEERVYPTVRTAVQGYLDSGDAPDQASVGTGTTMAPFIPEADGPVGASPAGEE